MQTIDLVLLFIALLFLGLLTAARLGSRLPRRPYLYPAAKAKGPGGRQRTERVRNLIYS